MRPLFSRTVKTTLLLLALLPVSATVAVYSKMPEIIPLYWNLDGTYSSGPKEQIWVTALLPVLLAVFFFFYPRLKVSSKIYERLRPIYNGLAICTLVFLYAYHMMIVTEGLYPGRLSPIRGVYLMFGILMVLLGILQARSREDHLFAFRNRWTRADASIWKKTQQLGATLFILSGLVLSVFSFSLELIALFQLFLILLVFSILLPSVLSAIWYYALPAEKRRKKD